MDKREWTHLFLALPPEDRQRIVRELGLVGEGEGVPPDHEVVAYYRAAFMRAAKRGLMDRVKQRIRELSHLDQPRGRDVGVLAD